MWKRSAKQGDPEYAVRRDQDDQAIRRAGTASNTSNAGIERGRVTRLVHLAERGMPRASEEFGFLDC
jgi:hypothetical protein